MARRRRPRKSSTGVTNRSSDPSLSRHVNDVFSGNEKKKKIARTRRRRHLTKTLYDAAMKRCDGQFRKLFRLFDEDRDGNISKEVRGVSSMNSFFT